MRAVLQALRVVADGECRPVLVADVLTELRRVGQGPTNELSTFVALEDLARDGLAWRYTDPEGRAVYWPDPVLTEFGEDEVTEPDRQRPDLAH